ncbi:MAG TPA: thioesterase family protein [Phycisphaerae bacterium]|nr:thioesterase family protein [Phycisphaerae bacterium]
MTDRAPTSCEIRIRVRYAECDPMGVLHHSRYFEYFEMARTELLRQAGSRYRDLEKRGILFVVAKVECRFRRPARYDDELTLKVEITRMTRARIDHKYELYRDGVLLCEATTVLACVDREGRVIPIPDEIVQP